MVSTKSNERLAQQVAAAESRLGERIVPGHEDPSVPLETEAAELQEQFPLRYQAYLGALRGIFSSAQLRELSTDLRVVNSLETYIAGLRSRTSDQAQLRDHQLDVFESLRDFFERGEKTGWIKLPTGSGKTAIFISLAEALGLRTLVVVPREKIVDQTHGAVEKFTDSINSTSFYGREKDLSGKIVVTTYQSLATLNQVAQDGGEAFDLVILDEAHRALTKKARQNVEEIPGRRYTLAFTATPVFSEQKNVGRFYGEMVHEMSIKEAIERGALSPVRAMIVETNISLDAATISAHGEYSQKELERAIDTEKRNLAAIKLLQELAGRHSSKALPSTVAFCVSIEHAEHLAELARAQGISAAALHGGMSPSERKQVEEAYERGDIKLLTSVDLITEGWDSPRTEIALNLRPTRSLVLAEQRPGRALRLFEGKSLALIIDFLDLGGSPDQERPISVVDILGGAVVCPPGAEEIFRTAYAGISEGIDLKIEGITVHTSETAVLEVCSRGVSPDLRLTSNEQVREILAEAGFEDPGSLVKGRIIDQLTTYLSTDRFRGSLRSLITRYSREVKGQESIHRIGRAELHNFIGDLFGAKAAEEMELRRVGRFISSEQIIKFLDEARVRSDPREILAEQRRIVYGNTGYDTTGEGFLRAVCWTHKLSFETAAAFDQDAIALLSAAIRKIRPSDAGAGYSVKRWSEGDRVAAAHTSGELAILLSSDPQLRFYLPSQFAARSYRTADGSAIRGSTILTLFKVRAAGDYLDLVDRYSAPGKHSPDFIRACELQLPGAVGEQQPEMDSGHLRELLENGRLIARRIVMKRLREAQPLLQSAHFSPWLVPLGGEQLLALLNDPLLFNGTINSDEEGFEKLARWAILGQGPAVGVPPAETSEGRRELERLLTDRCEITSYHQLQREELLEGAIQGAVFEWRAKNIRGDAWPLIHEFFEMKIGDAAGPSTTGRVVLQQQQIFDVGTFRDFIAPFMQADLAAYQAPIEKIDPVHCHSEFESYLKGDPERLRFMALSAFLEQEFPLPSGTINGKELLEALDLAPTHSAYRELLDGVMGQGFSREFWPANAQLMSRIFSDSVAAAGAQGASLRKLLAVPIQSAYFARPGWTMKDLILCWFANKNCSDSTLRERPLWEKPVNQPMLDQFLADMGARRG